MVCRLCDNSLINVNMRACLEILFAKYNCSCMTLEVTDFYDYTDVENSPVIPDAVKKVNTYALVCTCNVLFCKRKN